jgi:hypothetical protein
METAGIHAGASCHFLGWGFSLRENSKKWLQPASCRPSMRILSFAFFASQKTPGNYPQRPAKTKTICEILARRLVNAKSSDKRNNREQEF